MMGGIFEKYKENFNSFLAYFALSIIMALIMSNLDLPILKNRVIDPMDYFEVIFSVEFLKIIGISLIELYVISFGLETAGKVITDSRVDQKEVFSDALSYYPRLLGINIAFIIIIFLITLLFIFIMTLVSNNFIFIMLISILLAIALAVFGVFTSPIKSYLVYYDESIALSIKQGINIGKKYFFKILGLFIISSLIRGIIDTKIFQANMITLTIGS